MNAAYVKKINMVRDHIEIMTKIYQQRNSLISILKCVQDKKTLINQQVTKILLCAVKNKLLSVIFVVRIYTLQKVEIGIVLIKFVYKKPGQKNSTF